MPDVTITNNGSLIGFALHSKAAWTWAEEHIPEDASWMGNSFYAEPRYADDIATGMAADGLEVS